MNDRMNFSDTVRRNMERGLIEMVPDPPVVTYDPLAGLAMLREPIPADQVEKLPKPLWKGAWDNERAARCAVCHGYHVLSNAIHLDYCGHALTTDRLLDADPYWDWEPLALTDQGLPLFDKVGGLWIKLTVCGITRLGYGDGASPKEIIGDAIRNAAMRFGVALDLWSKADLHMDRNPGDGPTPQQPKQRGAVGTRDGEVRESHGPVATNPARAENQDALDALQSVCDEHGYSVQYCIDRFASDHDKHIRNGTVEEILLLAEQLADEATAEPDQVSTDGPTDLPKGPGGPAADEVERVDREQEDSSRLPMGEVDTSDVEKGPDDIF